MIKKEELLHLKVCDYLRKNYPDVLFRTDFSSGMKMRPGQAAKHKKFQKSRAWPDLFIAKPEQDVFRDSYSGEKYYKFYGGLFLELKAEGTKLYKKNRYAADFAVGYDQAIQIITDYLGEPKHKKVEF